jgi:hypothetical protein
MCTRPSSSSVAEKQAGRPCGRGLSALGAGGRRAEPEDHDVEAACGHHEDGRIVYVAPRTVKGLRLHLSGSGLGRADREANAIVRVKG